MSWWIVGVVLNLVGSVTVNAGTNLLKLSLKIKEEGYLCRFRYAQTRCVGGVLFVLGSLTNFVSFGLAAQSLLASLGGVQFVANCVFGKFILDETVTTRHLIASLILVAGVVIAVSFSNHDSTRYSLEDIIGFYDADYAWFMFGIGITVILSEILYRIYSWRETIVLSTNLDSDAKDFYPFHSFLKPVTFCWISACFGTQSVLQAKCIAEIGKMAILQQSFSLLFKREVILMIAAFIVFLAIWLKRLMIALSLYDGLVIIPILQVCWTISAVIHGSVFFKEFQSASARQVNMFSMGLSLVVIGVYILAGSESAPNRSSIASKSNPEVKIVYKNIDETQPENFTPL